MTTTFIISYAILLVCFALVSFWLWKSHKMIRELQDKLKDAKNDNMEKTRSIINLREQIAHYERLGKTLPPFRSLSDFYDYLSEVCPAGVEMSFLTHELYKLAISSETDRAYEAISNAELEMIVEVAKGEKGFYELSVQDKIKKLQSIRFAIFGKHGIPFDWAEKLAEHIIKSSGEDK